MSTEFDLSFVVEAFDAPQHPAEMSGVLFAEDFDLAAESDRPIAPTEPGPGASRPVYEEAQIHAARLLGFEDGRRAGLDEAIARAKLAEETAMHDVSRALAAAAAYAAEAARRAAQDTSRLMLDLLVAALPQFCARHGAAEAQALADALLPMLTHQPRITLRANPYTLLSLQQAVARHQRDNQARITLVGAEAMDRGDVSIEWPDGSAVRDTAMYRRELNAMLSPLGLSGATHKVSQMELAHVE